MPLRCFEKPSHAAAYAKFRPCPPPELISFIVDFVKEKVPSTESLLAVDVACGSGQSTRALAPYFGKVIGLDISAAQISEAENYPEQQPNISYKFCINSYLGIVHTKIRVSAAETLPIPDESIALLTVSEAFHWLDADAFLKEAKRVLIKDGVLAIYAYEHPRPLYPGCSDQLGVLVDQAFEETKTYWPLGRSPVNIGDQEFVLPFADTIKKRLVVEPERTVQEYFGYIETASGYQCMKDTDPVKATVFYDNFKKRFLQIIQRNDDLDLIKIKLHLLYSLHMCRKN